MRALVVPGATPSERHRSEDGRSTEPHDDLHFPETLAAFRDSGLFTVPELAEIVGLSRSRTYALLAEADRR